MTTNPRDRFFGLMFIVIMVAGLIWLALALLNARQGRPFNWTGLGGFLIILTALYIARGRGSHSK